MMTVTVPSRLTSTRAGVRPRRKPVRAVDRKVALREGIQSAPATELHIHEEGLICHGVLAPRARWRERVVVYGRVALEAPAIGSGYGGRHEAPSALIYPVRRPVDAAVCLA